MLILVSGEGPTDLGRCLGADPCEGDAFQPGPMAWLVDQIAETSERYSFLELHHSSHNWRAPWASRQRRRFWRNWCERVG